MNTEAIRSVLHSYGVNPEDESIPDCIAEIAAAGGIPGPETTLYVVTLYPYSDGGEARYQFTTREMAEAFAAHVNDLPEETLSYVNGEGKPTKVSVWESGTYPTVAAAVEALGEWVGDGEDEDE